MILATVGVQVHTEDDGGFNRWGPFGEAKNSQSQGLIMRPWECRRIWQTHMM